MAQSPGDNSVGPQTTKYLSGWDAISQLLYDGASWSGHERHCCFLNTRQGRFADVSAASGFDLLDDGRGMGLVDWDQDGDLDVWIANRSGPRIRFLRNDSPTANHFLTIKLVGTTCNRDAIGARLELHLAGQEHRPLIRTLRAGEGYLGQSTKWVHFGLGETGRIEKMIVRWPGGAAEEFDSLEPDRRYELVEGEGVRPWQARARNINLAAKPCQSPPSSSQARIVLSNRQAMPDLRYTDFAGRPHHLAEHQGRPFLLNVWASWCAPCVQELTEFGKHRDRLQVAGLDVVAMNFDGVGNADVGDLREARRLLKRIDAPLIEARGTPLIARTLEMGLRFYFDKAGQLPLPCSFLVDSSFRVAAIYFGPVSVDQLLADARLITAPPHVWQKASIPFPGRWADAPLEEPPVTARVSRREAATPQRRTRVTPLSTISAILVFLAIAVTLVVWRRRRSSAADAKRSRTGEPTG